MLRSDALASTDVDKHNKQFSDISELTSFRAPITSDGEIDVAADSAHLLLKTGTTVGDYVIEGILGQGGMGTVYAAIHPLIGKRAAIKVLKHKDTDEKHFAERFIQEARTVNQIANENIVDIFTYGTLADGRAYLVMEWLDGETLGKRLEKGLMPYEQALDCANQICSALSAAHKKDIVHRDLKPENVYLANLEKEHFKIKLLDFGIAKKTDHFKHSSLDSTETGVLMGTPAYVAPEQARGQEVSHKTDIYSLGCIFFELFTGERPFQAETAVEIVSKHLYVDAPLAINSNPTLSVNLSHLIDSMLAKDMDVRPSIDEVYAHLSQHTTASQTITRVRSPTFATTKKRQIWPLVLCGFACAIGMFTWMSIQKKSSELTENQSKDDVLSRVALSDKDSMSRDTGLSSATSEVAVGYSPAALVVRVAPKDAIVSVNGKQISLENGVLEFSEDAESEVVIVASSPGHLSEVKRIKLGQTNTIKEFHISLDRNLEEELDEPYKRLKKTASSPKTKLKVSSESTKNEAKNKTTTKVPIANSKNTRTNGTIDPFAN